MISTIIVCAIYVSAQLLSNIASLQIVLFAGLSFDAGTFIYPITFTLRDLAHKVLGLKGVRVLIITAVAINLFMSLFFWFVSSLQPDAAAGSSEIWGRVLSPVWRITIASVVSQLVSELVDTEVYRIWVDKITRRYQWMRVLVSNSISVPLDSLTFSFMAFYGTMPVDSVWGIFWANVIIKMLITLISLPFIYFVKEKGNA
ncbi:MAG: queuosine precursor transporter [Chloroflexi bacterium]|nr:queuosine precursor transporter [Chloroflexota bacterium]